MTKQLRKRALLICTGIVFLVPIAVFSHWSERRIQGKTNLRVVVTGLKQVAGSRQAVPVAGATVLVKPQPEGEVFAETTTDSQGVAIISDVPYGTVLIQVTADGWITSGHPYPLNKKEQTIPIQLDPERTPTPTPTPTPSPTPL